MVRRLFWRDHSIRTILILVVGAVLTIAASTIFSQVRPPRSYPPEGPSPQQQFWTSIGPSPLMYASGPANPDSFNSGRVSSIAVDPGDPSHWLIGFGNGGVWETHDAGTTFFPISDSWPTAAIGAVAFAPSDPSTIYVGTGQSDGGLGFEHIGLGIMKSADGGKTWGLFAASSFARGSVKCLRVHPTNPSLVLAATSRGGFGRDSEEAAPNSPPFGVLKSTDGGATWLRTLAGQATALEISPTNFNNQYAAIGDQRIGINFNFALPPGTPSFNDPPGDVANGIYRSADGGQTWALVAGPWGVSNSSMATVGRVELAIAPSNPSTLYAAIQIPPNGGSSGTGLLGLYRTDNAWDPVPNWILVPTSAGGVGGYCGPGKCGYSNVISVDPSDPDTLFAFGGQNGGQGGWRCTNCGPTPVWTNVMSNTRVHPDHHALTWVGSLLIDGNDGGVWSTADRGNTWQDHNATISTNMFFSGSLHPTNPNFILGGIRDFSLSVRAAGNVWQILPDIGTPEWGEAEVALSSSRPDTDWMAAWIFGAISRTTDGGKTAIAANGGIDVSGAAFVPPVRKCPNNDDVFLAGMNRLWRSTNFFSASAPVWVPNSPADTFPFPNTLEAPNTILSIEYLLSDASCNTYAYGTRAGAIWYTYNGGSTWVNLDPGKTLPARPVNGLAFDPNNPSILYAALSSFDDATPGKPGHVFKTTNALAGSPVWVNIGPPQNQPFNVIRVDPSDTQRVYAGSDIGLWSMKSGGWARVGERTGLFNASVYDIQINPVTGLTVAFTYGRGAYALRHDSVR